MVIVYKLLLIGAMVYSEVFKRVLVEILLELMR